MADIKHDTTFEELVADPKKFGLPTFAEFQKNPKLLDTRLNPLDSIDNGPQKLLLKSIQKISYLWRGYYFDKIEQVERAIISDGYDPLDLDYKPELIPQGGGKCNMIVELVRKDAGSTDAATGEPRGS